MTPPTPPRPRHSLAVALLASTLAFAGCVRPPASPPSAGPDETRPSTEELTGRDWRLVEVGGVPAVEGVPGREPHLRLDAAESRVTGSTGCNTFGGPFERSGDRLRFGELISTRMACVDPAAARQEQALVSALDATERFTISGDRLTLYGGDRPLAVFRAEPGG